MVPRIDAGAMVHVWLAMIVAAVPLQRATVRIVCPLVESPSAARVVGVERVARRRAGRGGVRLELERGARHVDVDTSLALPPFH